MNIDNKQSVLTVGQILTLDWHSNMTNDEIIRFARAVESAVLSKLRGAGEPAFYGFLDEKAMRVEVCLTPESPRADGEYATAYYAAPQSSAEARKYDGKDSLGSSLTLDPAHSGFQELDTAQQGKSGDEP